MVAAQEHPLINGLEMLSNNARSDHADPLRTALPVLVQMVS